MFLSLEYLKPRLRMSKLKAIRPSLKIMVVAYFDANEERTPTGKSLLSSDSVHKVDHSEV